MEGKPMQGKITAEDVWTILEVKPAQRSQDKFELMGDALKQLGWERIRLRVGGRSVLTSTSAARNHTSSSP